MPNSACEPRWFVKPQHMTLAEAVDAHKLLGSGTSLTIQHGVIQLTHEAIDAPVRELAVALPHHRVDRDNFLVPDVGETISIP